MKGEYTNLSRVDDEGYVDVAYSGKVTQLAYNVVLMIEAIQRTSPARLTHHKLQVVYDNVTNIVDIYGVIHGLQIFANCRFLNL